MFLKPQSQDDIWKEKDRIKELEVKLHNSHSKGKTTVTLLSRLRHVFKLPQLNKLPSSLKFKQKYVCERQRSACEQLTEVMLT